MASHVGVTDSFRVESRLFDRPVVLACRDDHVVEVYVVDDSGLEVYFGRLDQLERVGSANQAKLDVLLEAVGRRVREEPVSARSLAWLSALEPVSARSLAWLSALEGAGLFA